MVLKSSTLREVGLWRKEAITIAAGTRTLDLERLARL